MAKTLELPALGNSMEEGTITQWFKAEGDSVQKGESLYEVMTDKVNIEVESPESGVLRKILAGVDTFVPVGGPVAVIGTADEDDVARGQRFGRDRLQGHEVAVIHLAPHRVAARLHLHRLAPAQGFFGEQGPAHCLPLIYCPT